MGQPRRLAVARFTDRVRVVATGGNGGHGCASFFRDTRVERGPPDGGSGGTGGSVYVRASKHVGDLTMGQHSFRAGSGAHGSGSQMNGRRGLDAIITVPCGTTVQCLGPPTRALVPVAEVLRASPTLLADLLRDGDEALVAGGGTGGRGNVALRAGRLQSSRLAEDGIPGEQASLAHVPGLAHPCMVFGRNTLCGSFPLLHRPSSPQPTVPFLEAYAVLFSARASVHAQHPFVTGSDTPLGLWGDATCLAKPSNACAGDHPPHT